MKLSERDLRIVHSAQYRADLSAGEIARLAGTKEHNVRHLLARLIDSNALSRLVYVNTYPLGFSEYPVYVRVANHMGEIRKALEAKSMSLSRISWLAEMAGRFQFVFGIIARNGQDALFRFEELANSLDLHILEKSWIERIAWTYYGARYLNEKQNDNPVIEMGERSSAVSIDELDHRILREFCASTTGNITAIGRALNESASTVRHRLQRLQEKHILLGSVYHINPEYFGRQRHRLLMFTQSMNPELRQRLKQWAKSHCAVLTFVQNLGAWDYELRVETMSGQDANTLASELQSHFPEKFSKVEVVSEFRYFKLENYPFHQDSFNFIS